MKKLKLMLPLMGGVVFIAACTASSNETANSNAVQEVIVSDLIQMDTTVYQEYIADIQSQKNVELRSRLSGFLNKIYVDEGAAVRKGQVLFALNDEEYKADAAQADAALNTAIAEVKKVDLELERTKILVSKNIVSTTEKEFLIVQRKAAESKVQEAEAKLHQARTKLSQTQIRAPFDGRIDRILLKEGSLLNEGALLTTISDTERVNVYYTISEAEYLSMAADTAVNHKNLKQEVRLILANGEIYPSSGIAEFVENEFEASTGSISLRAKFDNPDGLLKHGASGRIAVPKRTGNLTFVHQKSVVEIQDKAYVFVLTPQNTLKMTPFKNGQRVGHYYIVNEGLSNSDKVVFEGVQALRDGMQVNPKTLKTDI